MIFGPWGREFDGSGFAFLDWGDLREVYLVLASEKNAIPVSFSQPLNDFSTFSESSKTVNALRLGG